MRGHIDLGKKGEDQAAEWLERKGHEILDRNWRYGRYELDLITLEGNTLHFIEVKCRQWSAYGPPEGSVNKKKIRNMMLAALAWRTKFKKHGRVQYDVLSVTLRPGEDPVFFFITDVYV
jgi:putative endonuclease